MKKKTKRYNKGNWMTMIAVILIFAVTLTFTGCSSKENATEATEDQKVAQEYEATPKKTTEIVVSDLEKVAEEESTEKSVEEKAEEQQSEEKVVANKTTTKADTKTEKKAVSQAKALPVATKVAQPQKKAQAKPYMSFYPANTIRYGDTVSITIGNADQLVGNSLFESTNKEVATIDQCGNVTVKSAGQTVIKVTFVGDDKHLSTTEEVLLTVNKGIPFYVVPTGLKAELGQPLGEIELPDGFSWENPEKRVGIVSVKGDEPTVMYTPQDLQNYEIIKGIKVEIQIVTSKDNGSSGSSSGGSGGSSSGGNGSGGNDSDNNDTEKPDEPDNPSVKPPVNPPVDQNPDYGTEDNNPNEDTNGGGVKPPDYSEGDNNQNQEPDYGNENNNPNEDANGGGVKPPDYSEGDNGNDSGNPPAGPDYGTEENNPPTGGNGGTGGTGGPGFSEGDTTTQSTPAIGDSSGGGLSFTEGDSN